MPSTIWSGKPRGPYPWNQRTAKQRAEDYLLARFQTEAERQEAARERYFKSVFVREKFFRLTKRKKAYDEYHRKLHAKRLKDEYAIAIHEALRASWQHMADTDEFTYQYPIEKKNTRIFKKNREEWLETQKELDKWDQKHEPADEEVESPKEKGKVSKGGKDKKAPPGPVPKPKDSKSRNKLLKKIPEKVEVDHSKLPDPLLWGKEALAYMQDVKARKAKELQEKFEAQQRERTERIEKEKADELLKEEMEEKGIQDLERQREEEQEALRNQEAQRVADEEEQKKRDYRMQMAVALMNERQAEWDEVTSRDHELLSMMMEDCLDEVYHEWLLWEAVRRKKEEERKAKRWNLCTEIMLQIVTMMDIQIDYKAEFNSEISATNWRGWKTLFVQGVILPCPIFGNVMPAEQSTADPNTIFAKVVVDQYLEEQGEWQGTHVIGKNKEFGLILAEVHDVADSPPDPPALPNLTQFKLKIAVVGTPFAGKSTVARKLEHDFGCVRIEMQNVVNSAVELAEAEEKIHKAKLTEEEKKREEADAQRILEEKQKLEYDRQQEALGLKDICLRSITRIEVCSPQSESIEPDMKAEPTSEKGRGKDGKDASKNEKGKGDLKDSKKSQKGGEKQKSDKGKKKEKEHPTGASQEPQPEPTPEPQPFGPPPEPPHPLAYLTPVARAGMEIKLAQTEGFPAPGNALGDLVLLTLSNLQVYADAHPAEAELPQKGDLKKGGKGGPAAKKTQAASKKDAPTSQRKSPSSSPRGKSKTEWEDPSDKVLGFILDGFPTNLGEAKALEWRLSGIDLDYIYNHHAKASRIAPPPELIVQVKSGLDGYFQLQAVDENECFKRAMGKVMDEKTGKTYHLDYDPPPTMKTNPKEKGIVQRLVPVEDLEVVRPKIIAGLELWPNLTQYLRNIINVFPVAQKEEDGKTMVDVLEPCTLAAKFLDGWSKTQAAKVAAEAGLEAQSVAYQALLDALNASKLANEVAHKLWCTKLAEVETEQGLDALGGDTMAKQLVKEKVSVTVAKRLDEVCKAAKEAQEAAEAARMASLQAEQRANLAKDTVDGADLEFSFHLKAEAEEAAEVAKQASLRADEAHKKALLAFEAATAALLPKPEVTTEDRKEGSKKDKSDPKNVKGAKEGKSAKTANDSTDSKDVKSPKGATGEQVTPDETAKVSPPDPGSSLQLGAAPLLLGAPLGEPHQKPLIDKELAVSLHREWEGVEANYLKQLEAVFNTLHKEKAITRNHVVQMISRFISFLQSRDERQQTFDDFQEKWNRIETPQRLDRKFKPKLVAEALKLDKTLKDICARREKRCIELSEESLVDLLESRTASLIKVFTGLVQTELDRHLQSCSLLKQYYAKTLGSDLLALRCALDEVTGEPSEKFPLPGWVVTLAAPMPNLYKVFMKAMSVAYLILDVISGKTLDKVDKKGKKGSEKKKDILGKKEEKKGKSSSKDKTQTEAGVATTTPIVDNPPPPLDPSIAPATAREHEIFIHRLQRIAKVALSYFDELQPIVDGAFKRMRDWSTPRLKAEAAVIQEVLDLCREAAEEQIPLWYRVYLDGDVFHVDESQLVLECPIKETTNLNLWFCKVLENLLTDFKEISPQENYMTAGLARSTITGAIIKTHTMFKNDLRESILPRLPASKRDPHGPFQAWQEHADHLFKEIIVDPTKEAKFVDWRALLIALVDAKYSNIISSASCEDILNARKALFPVATLDKEGVLKGPDTHGYLLIEDLLGIQFWFDPSAPQVPGEFNLGLALKIFLYNLLEEGPKGTQHRKLLLYICRDPNEKQALEKAFNVVAESGLLSSEHHLTPETVLGILYPSGVEAAWNQAIVPFIIDDLHNLLWYVAKEKWDKAERERESDLGGSEESGSNEDTKPCIKDGEVTSSTTGSDHATIEDFLDFAYKEFGELSQAETVKDFLCSLDVNKDTSSHFPDSDPGSFKCDVHVTIPVVQVAEVEEPDPYEIPETYTVQDIMKTTATRNLSNVLFGNYGSNRVQFFDQVTIEDDNEQEHQPEEEENGKKKKGKDKEKEKDKKDKKERREKKEKKEKKE